MCSGTGDTSKTQALISISFRQHYNGVFLQLNFITCPAFVAIFLYHLILFLKKGDLLLLKWSFRKKVYVWMSGGPRANEIGMFQSVNQAKPKIVWLQPNSFHPLLERSNGFVVVTAYNTPPEQIGISERTTAFLYYCLVGDWIVQRWKPVWSCQSGSYLVRMFFVIFVTFCSIASNWQ